MIPLGVVVFGVVACAAGCSVGQVDTDPSVDDAAMLASASSYGTWFIQVSRSAYPSVVSGSITVWASPDALPVYLQVSPETTGSVAQLAPGATIVRVMQDPSGAANTLTIMTKGPAGYNPDLGDWWFGEIAPQDELDVTPSPSIAGRARECYGCHLLRASDDFLFGVPQSDRR